MRRFALLALLAGSVSVAVTLSVMAQPPHEETPEEVAHEADEELEHDEHHHMTLGEVVDLDNYQFWGAVANFLMFALAVFILAEKPLGKLLVQRRDSVEEGLAEAQRLKAAAEKTRVEYETRLASLDAELERIRGEMIATGEAERDRVVAEAESKAARMRKDAEFMIEQQIKQLRIDVTREAAEAAVDAAKSVLLESTMPSDQHRLAQDYLARLATLGKGGAR